MLYMALRGSATANHLAASNGNRELLQAGPCTAGLRGELCQREMGQVLIGTQESWQADGRPIIWKHAKSSLQR